MKYDFNVRAFEIHSLYAWDFEWIIKSMDFMTANGFNTLILHRNDFIDLIVYPGKYFGCKKNHYNSIFERYARFGITERTLRYDGAERSLKMEQY